MRDISGDDFSILLTPDYKVHARLTIQNIPFADLLGTEPIESFVVSTDVNQPVWTARPILNLLEGPMNLSPYYPGGATFDGGGGSGPVALLTAPFFQDIEIQCTAPGAAPSGSGWRKLFTGLVDAIDVDPVGGKVTLDLRDRIASVLQDFEIENITDVVQPDSTTQPQWGFPVAAGLKEDALIAMLNAAYQYAYGGPYGDAVQINPGESGTSISAFWQGPANLMEALRDIAVGKDGWDLRGRWDLSGRNSFQLTHYLPDQTPVIGQYSFGRSRAAGGSVLVYSQITRLNWDRRGVKNIAEITPADEARVPVISTNTASLTRYQQRRFLRVSEDKASHIDTPAEAADLGAIIVNALGEPPNAIEIECPFVWFPEINDTFSVESDGRSYIQPAGGQVFSVTHIEHHFVKGKAWTVIGGRDGGGVPAAKARLDKWAAEPRGVYVSATAPVGPGKRGAIWVQPLEFPAVPTP